jgi:MFS family permease
MYALVYLGFSLADPNQQWQFWTLILAYGFYFGMAEGAEKALVADLVPSENRGTAFGVYAGAIGIAALPASLVFGIFWTQIGPHWAFGIGAALAGLAAILLLVLLSTNRKKVAPQ